ncbi:hypothetical protein KI387_011449 [Taxus chinensis]|uniref:Uncharacterized protein n=1 Tax=Taxus chinensis TaxID=29808 RepID=A0AA38FMT0_TAXCH|nr:hypothetical protein KI387_011449 [Taxus chinensis]
MTTPLHFLAYALNPKYYSSEIVGRAGRQRPYDDHEVANGTRLAFRRLFHDPATSLAVHQGMSMFVNGQGSMGEIEAICDKPTMDSITWWTCHGHDAKFLRPVAIKLISHALNALINLCKINKRRQEQAAENGIIPHLMHFIVTDSPLKQTALPLLCDMAHASRYTREQLRVHNGLDVYLSLLDDEAWAVTALDSLAVCLAHDNDHRKVEQALLKKEAIQKLVTFFQCCSEQSFVHILEPFLKIITKSARINTTLAVNGLTPLLVARLDHQDAIARLNLLKLIKAVYEHHPRPKQLIVENALPLKLQSLIEERRDGEHSGGQVLVKQMATALLKALHINTVL